MSPHRAEPQDKPELRNSWFWLGLFILPRYSALKMCLFPLLFAVSSWLLMEFVILWEFNQIKFWG